MVVVTLPSLMGDTPKKSLLRGRGTVTRVIPGQGFVVEVTFRILKVDRPNIGSGFKIIG